MLVMALSLSYVHAPVWHHPCSSLQPARCTRQGKLWLIQLACAEEQEACRHALQALLCFAPASGMHRSKQLQADLSAISASASLPDASAFAPGGHALAFAQTLESLKNSCSRTDPRGWTKAVLRQVTTPLHGPDLDELYITHLIIMHPAVTGIGSDALTSHLMST